jgi:hypothetical protein
MSVFAPQKAALVGRNLWRCAIAGVVFGLSALAGLSCVADDGVTKASAEQIEFFESKIRPIFVRHCYECHSAESGEDIEGGLLLDSRWGWQTGGDSGPAIVPGDPGESLVMHAIGYQEDIVSAMPPSSKLSAIEIERIEQWIRDGAVDPREKVTAESHAKTENFDLQDRFDQHWSWRPIEMPATPLLDQSKVRQSLWPVNFVDAFILKQLQEAELQPAEPASKETWLRRVYFDLIGLPPTVQQMDAFLASDSNKTREKIVDELLDSKHFGEKWARHWMDLVRYAETYGHEFDYAIPFSHEYRDYLIRAFNADVPYDQLIREHIAGDLIKEPRRHPEQEFNESIIGTGFWFLHEATHAPTDVLKNESDIIDNQIDVLGKTFLGLTVACARCHDHKFDAISTADYYALSGYIQSSCRQLYPLDPKQAIAKRVKQLDKLQSEYVAARKSGPTPFDQEARLAAYLDVAARRLFSDRQQSGESRTDAKDSGLDAGLVARWTKILGDAKRGLPTENPASAFAFAMSRPDAKTAIAEHLADQKKRREQFDGHCFVDFRSDRLPPGWSSSGHAFQAVGESSRFVPVAGQSLRRVGTVDSGVYGKRATGSLRSPTFQITANNMHLRVRASGDAKIRLIVDNYQMASFNPLLFKGVGLGKKTADTKGKWDWIHLGNDLRKYVGHNAYLEFVDENDASIAVDEIWFSNQALPPPAKPKMASLVQRYLEDSDAFWLTVEHDYRHAVNNPVVDWLIENRLVDMSRISERVKKVRAKTEKQAATIPRPRYVLAMAEGTRENAHVYVRGNSAMLGEELPPRNLQAFGGHAGDRLQLANEIATIKNPLTARVMVNRIWHHLFGRGIVPTTDDFGPQGLPASHPKLLDSLAVNFANDGWSLKKLIRTLALSQTYAQSSVTNSSNGIDHIAKVDPTNALLHRMRVRRLPAESIRDQVLAVSGQLSREQFGPSVPTYRTPFMTGRGARKSGPLDGDGRRSVYLAVYRNFLNPFMSTFDVPNPFGPKGRRSVSNVPAQSLTLLNDPFILEQSAKWAEQSLETEQSDEQRLVGMIRQAHGVAPSRSQINRLSTFVREQTDAGESEQQVWADVAHMLLNMKAAYYLR